MQIYKVSTEGDCEGRTIKVLGYVKANSPEHAIKYLDSIGKHAYYQYWIDVEDSLVIEASPESELNHLIAEIKNPIYEGGSFRGIVKKNLHVCKRKTKS
ncbi:hypothetical protein SP40_100 [Salmonella phage 40]|nr:hypothetical protein SP40_100 [Salmonella phage 40]